MKDPRPIVLDSYVADQWIRPSGEHRTLPSAVTGRAMALIGTASPDTAMMVDHARRTGGPALRSMTFHQRASMLRQLARYLDERREVLHALSFDTGATARDAALDIEGGIATLFVYASKGRRELPDDVLLLDGEPERISRGGQFLGQHVWTSLQGVAVHINAFNFPVWGMLEKLGPALMAGLPAIIKPASATAWLAEACFRLIVESGLLPAGAVQLVTGTTGDLLDRMTCQDVVSFTGSAQTARQLRTRPAILDHSVRFIAEQDSLNAAILGPDALPGTPEFERYVHEACLEMTTKAGQKCTAMRRLLVPASLRQAVLDALAELLSGIRIGDPRDPGTGMGPLVSLEQRRDVLDKTARFAAEACPAFGDPQDFVLHGADRQHGAFMPPLLFDCQDPDAARQLHAIEAFGPVATVMPYRTIEHAMELANRGMGSLVVSVFTRDGVLARKAVLAGAAYHGRLYFNDRDCGAEATGHGSPLPHLVHGGPGRAGGGEELGGLRAMTHYMQRSSLQASPALLGAITQNWNPGAPTPVPDRHPFRLRFRELGIGHTLWTDWRQVSLEDIEHFAAFTGDRFYAHMDDDAARANPFFPGRVAHGYLVLSFAAGLFVDPAPGPVLANYGLDRLRFMKPVSPGDRLKVRLTVKHKTPRTTSYGEVRWDVGVYDQDEEQVAGYELLTLNAL